MNTPMSSPLHIEKATEADKVAIVLLAEGQWHTSIGLSEATPYVIRYKYFVG